MGAFESGAQRLGTGGVVGPGVKSIDDRVKIGEPIAPEDPVKAPDALNLPRGSAARATDTTMRAKDLMTQPVVSVPPDASILEAAQLMLQHKISGLPVVDASGNMVGIVTEGDFLRRSEMGTLRRRPRWIEAFLGPGRLADEYAHASGRRIDEIMMTDVHGVNEDAALDEVVSIMERYRIKRVPVTRGQAIVGIITRTNLVRALMENARATAPISASDADIRERLLAHLQEQRWAVADSLGIIVVDGVVTLSGVLTDERQRQALCIAAENIPGVNRVEDQLSLLIPGTGLPCNQPVILGPH